MNSKRNTIFSVLGAILFLVVLILTSTSLWASEKTLVIADGMEARHLFGHSADMAGMNRVYNICEALVFIDHKTKANPGLATEWNVIDGKKWRLKLRKGVTFHNGDKFSVEDVVFSIKYAQDPKNKDERANIVKKIIYNVVDDYTIDLWQQDGVDPILPKMFWDFKILPKALERIGAQEFGRAPIGTGPWVFVEWKRGEYLKLKANDNYWGGRPKIDYVVIKPIPERGARIAGLKAGIVDIIPGITPDDLPSLEKDPNIQILKVSSNFCMSLGFDLRKSPFDNIWMRKAVAHAIDSEKINKFILGGLGRIEGQLTSKTNFGYNPNIKPYPYDPIFAKECLKKAGYKGERILFESQSGRYLKDLEINTVIASNLTAIGMNIDLQVLDWPTWIDKYLHRTISPMFLVGWIDKVGDGSESLFNEASSKSPYNFFGDTFNPEVDSLIEKSRSVIDTKERELALQKANEILHETYFSGLFYTPTAVFGARKGVKWEPRGDELFIVTKDTDKQN